MDSRKLFWVMSLALAVIALCWGGNPAQAGPGTRAPEAATTPSEGTFYANSPLGTWQYCNAVGTCTGPSDSGTPLRKFVDKLPGVGPANANLLGQYIPIATKATNPDPDDPLNPADYYEMEILAYTEQMHSDLPKATKLRGYRDLNSGAPAHYLGPLIVAQRNKPVRIKFTNNLPKSDLLGSDQLFIPVDTTVMGAGFGPVDSQNAAEVCDPENLLPGQTCASYTQNRTAVHLHGGFTPWISDGTPHQWFTPDLDPTFLPKGVSFRNVPDMPTGSVSGSQTIFYSNQQSGRLMFYHDHAVGLTRLNVYAGLAAGYLLTDPMEQALITAGTIPGNAMPAEYHYGIPLIIQDKTFVPKDVAVQDAKWINSSYPTRGTYGDLWFPHVYETNQNPPGGGDGTNAFGRWDYGPWFWPVFPVNNGVLPEPSLVPEAFMDTPIVNGTAYPYLNVDRKAYRFRILNACNDRFLNLQLYFADPATISSDGRKGTEVRLVPAVQRLPAEVATGFESGLALYQDGNWSWINTKNPEDMVYSDATSTLYADFGNSGLWKYDGGSWAQITSANPVKMVTAGSALYVDFGKLWKYENDSWTLVHDSSPQRMRAAGGVVYLDLYPNGVWKNDSAVGTWTLVHSSSPKSMIASGSLLYLDYNWGVWKVDNATGTWTQIHWSSPKSMIASGSLLYLNYNWGVWRVDSATGTWTLVHSSSPNNMTASGSLLYLDYNWGFWKVDTGIPSWTQINTVGPTDMVATGTGLYADYGSSGLWKYDTAGWARLSADNPGKIVPVSFAFPPNWPTDGRAGGVPDPALRGPEMIQIGTEGGFLPAPVVIPNQPIDYEYFRRSVTVLNVSTKALFLGPAERADVIIDFSQVPAGSTLIIYNDAPAPVPAFDTRIDYYTGDPDQLASGGAPSTKVGFGPNTRTIMQFRVSNSAADPPFNVATLQTALPAAFATSQDQPIIAESGYGTAYGVTLPDNYASIFIGTLNYPTFNFTDINSNLVSLPVQNKAIQELFEPEYGRMNATLGVELPFTSALNQTTIPLGYIDPATETFSPNALEPRQIWKITHNGVDTHAVHFHLVNVQVINRVGWDGTVKPPDANELGWKETVRMNPLEDIIVAMKPTLPTTPFAVTDSTRLLNPARPEGSLMGFTQVDPTTGNPPLVPITNQPFNFHHEYVWHCHLLGHEENDMMRPIVVDPGP
jgi:FtsP/CotA-like multicopper oxidase with cupredoxin domain